MKPSVSTPLGGGGSDLDTGVVSSVHCSRDVLPAAQLPLFSARCGRGPRWPILAPKPPQRSIACSVNDSIARVIADLLTVARSARLSAVEHSAAPAAPSMLIVRSHWRGPSLPNLLSSSMRMTMRAVRYSEDVALTIVSALDVTGLTPLGPLPQVIRGCGAAGTRCHCDDLGVAVADPPPLYHLTGGLPIAWFFSMPWVARPCSETVRRRLQGFRIAPLSWAPATSGMGLVLGAVTNNLPHPGPRHVLRKLQRCCVTAGGVFDGLAPPHWRAAGIILRV